MKIFEHKEAVERVIQINNDIIYIFIIIADVQYYINKNILFV